MTRHSSSLPANYFETMFRDTPDPWDLDTSTYEQAKFQHSVEALSGRHYRSGFEVGCAKGMLTRKLSPNCSALLAIDVSETALRAARHRCETLNQVTFARMEFPAEAPDGQYDLIILSEVAYYWDDPALARAGEWLNRHLVPGGDLLLVHFTEETDYPQSGDEAVAKLFAALGTQMTVEREERRPRYRLDLWRYRP